MGSEPFSPGASGELERVDGVWSVPTEQPNPASRGIDVKSAREIVEIIHREDLQAWQAVGTALDAIAAVVEEIVGAFRAGGRLVYVGAGTSGRLGVLDAVECPPTFGVSRDLVTAIVAGGERALTEAVEGAEDSEEEGRDSIRRCGVRARDIVCGIAASGTTPFVWGALEEAALRDATTVLITCNEGWCSGTRAALVDYAIVLPVGPEVIAGSTRMKAGTASKMVLNMLSTAAMIRWGKVYDNLMVDVVPTNEKLRARALGIVSKVAGVDLARAGELLAAASGDVKTAIVVGRSGVDPKTARELLERHGGILRKALGEGDSSD